MGWKHHALSSANLAARAGLSFNQKLPSYYHGHWVWLCKKCWASLYLGYEPYMAEAITANLSRGGTFWDIGANIGLFSLLASKIVGADGNVVAFEPSPDVFALLRANTAGNSLIQVFQYGIGNAEGTMSFAAQGTGSSSSFVQEVTELNRDHNRGQRIENVSVTMRKIDTLLDEMPPPSLAKIDVEGFELEVLRGAERLLSEVRPTLVIEVHPPQLTMSSGSEAALLELLTRRRYQWDIIDRNPNSLYSIVARPHPQ